MSVSEFLRYAMHEDPITVGLVIFLVLAVPTGLPVFLMVGPTKRNHERLHQFHSELVCDYCTARSRAVSYSEGRRRWPMRVLGDRPPRGTG